MKSFKDTVSKFYSMQESLALDEVLTAKTPTSKWIDDFVNSDNPKFAGKSKKERIQMALGAAYAAKRQNEELEIDLEEVDRLAESFDIEIINEVTADDWLKGAEDARVAAMKAKSENKMPEFHEHMADHHEHLINYHELKGNQKNADTHYEKMMKHIEDESKLSEATDSQDVVESTLEFKRTHIPSGKETSGKFNASHDEIFANPDWYSKKTLNAKTDELLTKWNRQQPNEWKYEKHVNEELEEGRTSQRHPLEDHPYHSKSNAELEYIAKDAHAAAEAMKNHNTTAENKYRDQASDSATVRHWRQQNGMPSWYKNKYKLNEEFNEELFAVEEEVELDENVGASMGNTRKLTHHIQGLGWKLARTTGSHDVFTHSKSEQHIAVPRHKELKAPLVLSILKIAKVPKLVEDAELDEGRGFRGVNGARYREDDENHALDKGNWYIRAHGKNLTDAKGTLIPFTSMAAANAHALKHADKHGIPLTAMHLTKSWMDAPDKMAEAYMPAISASIAGSQGSMGRASAKAALLRKRAQGKTTPRNFVAKHAPTTGAGSHGNKKKENKDSHSFMEDSVVEANKMKDTDPCWTGYEMVGTKKKNGKEVPNCVPSVKEDIEQIDELSKKTLSSYMNKADTNVRDLSRKWVSGTPEQKAKAYAQIDKKISDRFDSMDKAASKLKEESENVEEATAITPTHTHVVVDTKTGNIVSKHTNRLTASRSANRRDMEYGAVRYIVKPITK